MSQIVTDATIEDVIDSAAQFYGVNPVYAKAIAFQRSEFNDKLIAHGIGLFQIEPTSELSQADLLNAITNAHVGIKALQGTDTTPDTVTADIVNAVSNGNFPPNWNNGIRKHTGLTVTFETPEVVDTPTEAPTEAPSTVGTPTVSDNTPSESTALIAPDVFSFLREHGYAWHSMSLSADGKELSLTIVLS